MIIRVSAVSFGCVCVCVCVCVCKGASMHCVPQCVPWWKCHLAMYYTCNNGPLHPWGSPKYRLQLPQTWQRQGRHISLRQENPHRQ